MTASAPWRHLPLALCLVMGALVAPGGDATAAAEQDLQARIDAAAPGSTLEIDGGTFGPIVIDKPLNLIGNNWPIIDAGQAGDVVQVLSSDVTIEGFVIRGSGISVTNSDAGVVVRDIAEGVSNLRVIGNQIEDVLFGVSFDRVSDSEVSGNRIVGKDLEPSRRGDSIRLFESHGITIEDNNARVGRDVAFWYSSELTVRNNIFADSRYGLHSMYTDDILLEENSFRDSSVGAFLMYGGELRVMRNEFIDNFGPSGYGLGLKDVDGVEIVGNRFLANRVGVFNDNSPGKGGIVHHTVNNVFAFNEVGILLMPAVQHNIFYENAFIDNTDQVALTSQGQLKNVEWSHEGRGNYWNDYAGYDSDRDGVGDREYRVDNLFSSMKDSYPYLMFFTGTPAAAAVEMAGRAFPDLRPEPKLTDPYPLVGIPDFPPMIAGEETHSALSVMAVSAAMLLLAGAIVATTRRKQTTEAMAR